MQLARMQSSGRMLTSSARIQSSARMQSSGELEELKERLKEIRFETAELKEQIKGTTDPAMTTLLLEKEVAMRKVQAAMLQKEVLLMQGEQA